MTLAVKREVPKLFTAALLCVQLGAIVQVGHLS